MLGSISARSLVVCGALILSVVACDDRSGGFDPIQREKSAEVILRNLDDPERAKAELDWIDQIQTELKATVYKNKDVESENEVSIGNVILGIELSPSDAEEEALILKALIGAEEDFFHAESTFRLGEGKTQATSSFQVLDSLESLEVTDDFSERLAQIKSPEMGDLDIRCLSAECGVIALTVVVSDKEAVEDKTYFMLTSIFSKSAEGWVFNRASVTNPKSYEGVLQLIAGQKDSAAIQRVAEAQTFVVDVPEAMMKKESCESQKLIDALAPMASLAEGTPLDVAVAACNEGSTSQFCKDLPEVIKQVQANIKQNELCKKTNNSILNNVGKALYFSAPGSGFSLARLSPEEREKLIGSNKREKAKIDSTATAEEKVEEVVEPVKPVVDGNVVPERFVGDEPLLKDKEYNRREVLFMPTENSRGFYVMGKSVLEFLEDHHSVRGGYNHESISELCREDLESYWITPDDPCERGMLLPTDSSRETYKWIDWPATEEGKAIIKEAKAKREQRLNGNRRTCLDRAYGVGCN